MNNLGGAPYPYEMGPPGQMEQRRNGTYTGVDHSSMMRGHGNMSGGDM
jgi:hypothetical protein